MEDDHSLRRASQRRAPASKSATPSAASSLASKPSTPINHFGQVGTLVDEPISPLLPPDWAPLHSYLLDRVPNSNTSKAIIPSSTAGCENPNNTTAVAPLTQLDPADVVVRPFCAGVDDVVAAKDDQPFEFPPVKKCKIKDGSVFLDETVGQPHFGAFTSKIKQSLDLVQGLPDSPPMGTIFEFAIPPPPQQIQTSEQTPASTTAPHPYQPPWMIKYPDLFVKSTLKHPSKHSILKPSLTSGIDERAALNRTIKMTRKQLENEIQRYGSDDVRSKYAQRARECAKAHRVLMHHIRHTLRTQRTAAHINTAFWNKQQSEYMRALYVALWRQHDADKTARDAFLANQINTSAHSVDNGIGTHHHTKAAEGHSDHAHRLHENDNHMHDQRAMEEGDDGDEVDEEEEEDMNSSTDHVLQHQHSAANHNTSASSLNSAPAPGTMSRSRGAAQSTRRKQTQSTASGAAEAARPRTKAQLGRSFTNARVPCRYASVVNFREFHPPKTITMQCASLSMLFSPYCSKHILHDRNQTLYAQCTYRNLEGVQCTNPVPKLSQSGMCSNHPAAPPPISAAPSAIAPPNAAMNNAMMMAARNAPIPSPPVSTTTQIPQTLPPRSTVTPGPIHPNNNALSSSSIHTHTSTTANNNDMVVNTGMTTNTASPPIFHPGALGGGVDDLSGSLSSPMLGLSQAMLPPSTSNNHLGGVLAPQQGNNNSHQTFMMMHSSILGGNNPMLNNGLNAGADLMGLGVHQQFDENAMLDDDEF
eukprot:c5534_g1_i1.p1 GENE.c5534_g1_i1~~c5534_g1_i1.p1  ORF type:complete len:758 (+),score=153.15 c5534_g1_i1:103-2376(+)